MNAGHAVALMALGLIVATVALIPPSQTQAGVTVALSRQHVRKDGSLVVTIFDDTRTGSDDGFDSAPFNDENVNRVAVAFQYLATGKTVTMRAMELGPALNVYLLVVTVREQEVSVTTEGGEVLPVTDGDIIVLTYGSISELIRVDNTPPVISVVSPEDEAVFPLGMVTFSAEVRDSAQSFTTHLEEIQQQLATDGIIRLIIGGVDIPGREMDFTSVEDGWEISFIAALDSVQSGTRLPWSVLATDRAGNTAAVSRVLTVGVPVTTPTATPTATPTPNPTATPPPIPTPVPSPTLSGSPSPSPTATPTTPASPTPLPTFTPILSATPTPTVTPLALLALTRATPTPAATPRPLSSPTPTLSPTPTPMSAVDSIPAPPGTPQETATATPIPMPEEGGFCGRGEVNELSLLLGLGVLLGLTLRGPQLHPPPRYPGVGLGPGQRRGRGQRRLHRHLPI